MITSRRVEETEQAGAQARQGTRTASARHPAASEPLALQGQSLSNTCLVLELVYLEHMCVRVDVCVRGCVCVCL